MDILSNTNVYGELRAVKMRQSFSNLFDISSSEYHTFFVPVIHSLKIIFRVGQTDNIIASGFFKKSNPPLIQAFDIDSGKQVLLDYSIVVEYGEDIALYKAMRSDSSTEQNLLITIVGIMAPNTYGPQI